MTSLDWTLHMADIEEKAGGFPGSLNRQPGVKLKAPNQNIDVKFFQCRTPGDWMARVIMSEKETFVVGPGDMRAILAGVGNLVALEARYADTRVHGTTTHEITQPRKMSDLKEYRRLAKEPD